MTEPILNQVDSSSAEGKAEDKKLTHSIGGIDKHGNTIKYIYSSSYFHVLYEIDGPIEQSFISFIDRGTPIAEQYFENLNTIKHKLNELKGVLYKCGNDDVVRNRRGTITALGLINPQEAIEQLVDLINDINKNYREGFEKKIFYLGGAFFMLLLFCTISFIIRVKAIGGSIDSKFETLELIFYILTSGVIGGFISVSYKLKLVVFEQGISRYYFLAYGIERLVISVLASMVLFFAIKANVIFGFVKDAPNPFYGYIFLSILAGFSETLIPDLLIKIEKQGLSEKAKSKD
jgi:hypothetical protein